MLYGKGFPSINGNGLLDHRSLLQCGMICLNGSVLSVFYRQGFSFIDGLGYWIIDPLWSDAADFMARCLVFYR